MENIYIENIDTSIGLVSGLRVTTAYGDVDLS